MDVFIRQDVFANIDMKETKSKLNSGVQNGIKKSNENRMINVVDECERLLLQSSIQIHAYSPYMHTITNTHTRNPKTLKHSHVRC